MEMENNIPKKHLMNCRRTKKKQNKSKKTQRDLIFLLVLGFFIYNVYI